MKKRIEDYLHLYMGCDIQTNISKFLSIGSLMFSSLDSDSYESIMHSLKEFKDAYCKPILRPLSDIRVNEVMALCKIEGLVNAEVVSRDATCIWLKDDSYNLLISFTGNITLYKGGLPYPMAKGFEMTRYLLENKFDLFRLIEDKLAINKLSLKTT